MIAALATFRARLAQSPLARRFLGGAAWAFIGTVASSGITLVTMIFVARLLGKETYGQFVLIQSTLSMVGVFAGFGIGATATRYIAALKLCDTSRLGHILALSERTVLLFGIVVSCSLAVLSGSIATDVLSAPELALPLSIAAFAVFFTAMDGYQKSVLIGFESMRALAIGTVAGVSVSLPVMLLAADWFGLDGVAGALVVGVLLQSAISRTQAVRQLRRYGVRLDAHGCLVEWRVIRDFAFPALLAGVLVTPTHWVCQALLANTPSGYAELAVLGVAMQWFNVIMLLPSIAGRMVLPILTEYVSSDNHVDSKRLLLLAIKANAVIALPMAGVIAALSPWIISLYGPEFQSGSLVLAIAVLTAALLAIMSPVGNMVAAASRMWLGVLMNLGWALFYIGFAYLYLEFGALGIAGAMGAAYLMHSIWVALWTRKILLR